MACLYLTVDFLQIGCRLTQQPLERTSMYRPSAAAAFARNFMQRAVNAGTDALAVSAEALMGALVKMGIYEQAMRENRRRTRTAKREGHSARNAIAGLNGKRAVARRQRQIAAGSLRVENGLVADPYFVDAYAHPNDYGLAS
jgi:hypothetical protein